MDNMGNNTFELALSTAMSLPMVKIDRENFLRRELGKRCSKEQVNAAIQKNPNSVGIPKEIIEKIAVSCIKYETKKASIISFAAGIPGGVAMAATVPADTTQYLGHMLRIMQKLLFLYGCEGLIYTDGEMDDETQNMLVLLFGVMFGVNHAGVVIAKICEGTAARAVKTLAQKSLMKTFYYPIIKKIAKAIGVRMTRQIFAEGVGKAIPIIGGVISGGLTYGTVMPMAQKLKKYLVDLNEGKAVPAEYKDIDIIDIDFDSLDDFRSQ